jgi:hypothetical protein
VAVRGLAEWEDLARETKETLADAKVNSALFKEENAALFQENAALQKAALAHLVARLSSRT